MKCQILFSGKNKKNILKCRLLQILPRVLSVNINNNWSLNDIHINIIKHAMLIKLLTLKMPRKPASENVVCLCRLLNILANFANLFYAYRQTVWTPIRLLL